MSQSKQLEIIAEVNIGEEKVVQVSSLELNEEKKQAVIAIALTNSRIHGLFDQGAKVTDFNPAYYIDLETSLVEFEAEIRITLDDKLYVALIDLGNEKLKSFITRLRWTPCLGQGRGLIKREPCHPQGV